MITRFFGDAEYEFHIGVDEAMEWERAQSKSLYRSFQEFTSGSFFLKDAKEVLRIGLIGGGMEPVKAFSLVEAYLGKPKFEGSIKLAIELLQDAFIDDSEPGDLVAVKILELEKALEDSGEQLETTLVEWRDTITGIARKVYQD